MATNNANSEAITLEELLAYPDERFIYHAYRILLERAPDPEGMLYYLKRIRFGVSRIEIVAQLHLSKEGKSKRVNLLGLNKAVLPYRWFRFPVVGLSARIVSLLETPRVQKVETVTQHEMVADTNSKIEEEFGSIAFRLAAVNQLEFNSDEEKFWKSLGNDPHFNLVLLEKNPIPCGWYCVDLEIASDFKYGLARFYLDTGNGFNESEIVELPYTSGGLTSRIFFAEKHILAVRFDPKESCGKFRIDKLCVTSISESQALLGMAKKLATSHTIYVGMRLEDVIPCVEVLARLDQQSLVQYISKQYASTFDNRQTGIDYEEWMANIEKYDMPTKNQVLANVVNLESRPLVSIVMPVYNTPEMYLRACIDSVLAQSYPHWELCIADDASPNVDVRRILEEYQQSDERIHVVFREKNGHISKASNSALEIATGGFVALLDHDDVLSEHALYFMVVAINEHPDAQVFYSDEDKIDKDGTRFDPHFKSDWNPDLFFSQNYVSHLGIYKRELLARIGGFRVGVEGSQDQDLLLRCLPHIQADQIVHVPRVLYHWRAAEGSTAQNVEAKGYANKAGMKALSDYFKSQKMRGVQVQNGIAANTYRIRYPTPSPEPLVSLLIPTRDRLNLVEPCVRSILNKSTYRNYEILILDNGSVEAKTLRFFQSIQREDKRVKIVRYDHPFNYSAINNYGVLQAKGSIIGLINNDIEVISSEWLTEMVSHVCRAEIGCVGAKLYFQNDTVQHGGVICSLGGVAGHSHKYYPRNHMGYFHRLVLTQTLSAVTAACLLLRREVYEQVSGLDEINLKVAFNDVDLCLKVREAGYRNLWTPYAEMYHYESISRGVDDTPEKRARFQSEVLFMQSKWGKALQYDPYYNINLTRDHEDFSIGVNFGVR